MSRIQNYLYQKIKTRLFFICIFFLFFLTCIEFGILGIGYYYKSRFPRGLYGAYYRNTQWQGEAWKKDVLDTEFSRHTKDFQPLIQDSQNHFSIEWTGYVEIPKTNEYTFFTNSDDGSWLLIDDTMVVDNGGAHGLQEVQGRIPLTRGLHKITIRYVQMGGYAVFKVAWAKGNSSKTPLTSEFLFPPGTNIPGFRRYLIIKKLFPIAQSGLLAFIVVWEILGISVFIRSKKISGRIERLSVFCHRYLSYNLIRNLSLLCVISLQLVFFFYFTRANWFIREHDSFSYFSLQYYFLNNVVIAGEIPQWLPFSTHGSVAAWWYAIQAGLWQNILLFIGGGFLKSIDFSVLFNAGLFFDEFLLLIGLWLLGKRLFRSSLTIFFVIVSVLGACIWAHQPWYNFHFYYAIPFLLYLLHAFLETGKWRYFILFWNLLALQTLGNLPYMIPITSLVCFLYLFFYAIFHSKLFLKQVRLIRWKWYSIIITVLIAFLSFGASYAVLRIGTEQIANYNLLRNLDGTASLGTFLTYAGNLGLVKWKELFLRVAPNMDYCLYSGALTLPLMVVGMLAEFKRKRFPLTCLVITLLLFSSGTFVSKFFYYTWPMMKYYRHLSLVASILRIFLILLSGIGFEEVFLLRGNARFFSSKALRQGHSVQGSYLKAEVLQKCTLFLLIILAVTMFAISAYILTLINSPDKALNTIDTMVTGGLPKTKAHPDEDSLKTIFDSSVLRSRLIVSLIFMQLSGLMLLFSPRFLQLISGESNARKYSFLIVACVFCFHIFDMYEYKFSETKLRTIQLSKAKIQTLTSYQSHPFEKRTAEPQIFVQRFGILQNDFPIKNWPGLHHWTNQSFMFFDLLGTERASQFEVRTDYWLLPLDHFMRAYWGQPSLDQTEPPLGKVKHFLYFPEGHPAIPKIAGFTEEKVQFFRKVYWSDSFEEVANSMREPQYQGDTIFLTGPNNSFPDNRKSVMFLDKTSNLSLNTRLRIPYKVIRFDANNLEVSVEVNSNESIWMLYSDVWHPFWNAEVNGIQTPVYRANLAYKAIELFPGTNRVHFYFRSSWTLYLYRFFGLNSLLWVMILVWSFSKEVFSFFGNR